MERIGIVGFCSLASIGRMRIYLNAEIIAVGTELLLGDIVNTNAQYLAKELAKHGIGLYYQTVVGDNAERLLKAYEYAFQHADLIITTGGLGPTEDDLTKETAAKYFGRELIVDEESLQRIEVFFERTQLKMTKNNRKQALIPKDAIVLPNEKGTAPGCIIEQDGKIIIMMPGPPDEMIPMFEATVVPFLEKKSSNHFISRILRICGLGESMVEEMLKDLIDSQSNPSIAPYAKTSEVHLRLTASAESEEEAKNIIDPIANEIYNRLGSNIYGEGKATLEETVVKTLKEKNMSLACAESCTGGLLTARLVGVSGVSQILKESVVTYSNEAKMKRINVKEETLNGFGAVSPETALEMAEGVALTSETDIGVSITGIAGPEGGTIEKPVGLVYIGLYIKGKKMVKELRLSGDREKIRNRVVVNALDYMRREICNV